MTKITRKHIKTTRKPYIVTIFSENNWLKYINVRQMNIGVWNDESFIIKEIVLILILMGNNWDDLFYN